MHNQLSLNSKPTVFWKKNYNKEKNVNKNIKLVPSLTKRRRLQLLNKLQISLNVSKDNGILDAVKFVFVDLHGSLKLVGPPGNSTFKLIPWSIGVLFCCCSLCFLALNWSVIALLIGGPSEARLSPEVKLFCESMFNPIFTRQNSFVDFQLCSRCAHGNKIKISLNIVVDNNSST